MENIGYISENSIKIKNKEKAYLFIQTVEYMKATTKITKKVGKGAKYISTATSMSDNSDPIGSMVKGHFIG